MRTAPPRSCAPSLQLATPLPPFRFADQAMLQAQAYYSSSMPGLDFIVLLTFTWFLLAAHVVNILSGAAQAAGFVRRIFGAFCLTGLIGLAFLLQDLATISTATRQTLICVLAALTAVAQILLEPALFGLAATLPGRGSATQAMFVGNGAAGVVVVGISVLVRFAAGGSEPSPVQLRLSAQVFFGVSILYSGICAAIFTALLRGNLLPPSSSGNLLPPLGKLLPPSSSGNLLPPLGNLLPPSSTCGVDGASSTTLPTECRAGTDTKASWHDPLCARVRGLASAARVAGMPACCQFLIFGTTLAAWPSIPGGACALGDFGALGQGWWFDLVVALYNLLDFAARLHLPRLQHAARHASQRATLAASGARLLLVPLIYACVRPRLIGGGAGNATILVAVAILALTNGFLATLSMMQLPRSPAALSEDAVYVAVAMLYFGLATGATVSWAVGTRAMHLSELDCPG